MQIDVHAHAGQLVPTAPADPRHQRISRLVTGLCWLALFAEGYDMGALGAVLPSLMADPAWRLGPAAAGAIGSAALVGMFFGGYIFGVVGDRRGRRPAFIGCFALFSLASLFAALAPTPLLFATCRFVIGVGVGGIVPVAAALTSEYATPDKKNRQFALMYTGYSLGIFAAAVASALLVQQHGWRLIVGLGAAALLLLPAIVRLLPESIDYLQSHGRGAEASALSARFGIAIADGDPGARDAAAYRPGLRALFGIGWARATIGFWLATFAGMILVYGLNTWLPQIMRASGYDLGPSIMFLGVFALASAAGGVLLGAIADRLGRAPTTIAAFVVGAVAIAALAIRWPLPITYAIVAVAGIGSVSAAVMVTSYLASFFPATLRATAVGCCLSFSRFGAICGPMLGGLLAQYAVAPYWNFAMFALAALMAAGSMLLIPHRPSAS